MAGFLDQNTQVMDVVLTNRGNQLLSQGKLRFVYWSVFDDEVDYDPVIMGSGSLTSTQLSETRQQHIELTPVREATTGYSRGLNFLMLDQTNVSASLFSMPQGSVYIPRMTGSFGSSTGSIQVQQQKLQFLTLVRDQNGNVIDQIGPYDQGYDRFDSSVVDISLGYAPGSFPNTLVPNGFLVKVYSSSSNGYVLVPERVDSQGRTSYNNDLLLDTK